MSNIGRAVPNMMWLMQTSDGKIFSEHSQFIQSTANTQLIDFIMACITISELIRIAALTSINLPKDHKREVIVREILKFFGVLILGTRYEFTTRRELWSTTPRTKYLCAPAIGNRTGMSRIRFNGI